MSHSAIYIGNTTIAEVDGLAHQDGVFQNDATVTLESLIDTVTGEAVTGIAVPLALDYVAGSDGQYRGEIPHDVSIVKGRTYDALIKVVGALGRNAQWIETALAQKRTA